jgi:hypothetical protein
VRLLCPLTKKKDNILSAHNQIDTGNLLSNVLTFYFFVASFLDPRVAPLLGDMMTPDDYNMLKSNVIDFMVTKIKANAKLFDKNALKQSSAPSAPATKPPKNDSKSYRLKDKMFWGLNTKASDAATATGNN